jgi:hypothetical protein
MDLLERLHRCDYLGALSCLHEDEKEHVYRRGTPYGGRYQGRSNIWKIMWRRSVIGSIRRNTI